MGIPELQAEGYKKSKRGFVQLSLLSFWDPDSTRFTLITLSPNNLTFLVLHPLTLSTHDPPDSSTLVPTTMRLSIIALLSVLSVTSVSPPGFRTPFHSAPLVG